MNSRTVPGTLLQRAQVLLLPKRSDVTPKLVERITTLGLQERYGSAEELADVISRDMNAWRAFLAANPVTK